MDFQSPDDIEATKAIKRTSQKSPASRTHGTSQRSFGVGGTAVASSHPKSTIKAYFQPIPKPNNTDLSYGSSRANNTVKPDKTDVIIDAEKELARLLSPQKYSDDDDDDVDDDKIAINVDNNNDIESDVDDYEMAIDTTMRKSAYMSEKSTKKKIYKDGAIVLSRPQRKDKGKPRFTAYMLWSKEIRQEMLKSNPNMDFSQASRRLSAMWAIVPNNEKNIWRRRARRVTIKNKRALKTGEKLTNNYLNKPGQKKPGRKPKHAKDTVAAVASAPVATSVARAAVSAITTPSKKSKSDRRTHTSNSVRNDDTPKSKPRTISSSSSGLGTILPGAYKVTGTGPSDVAAHLKLLGDNLTIIGQRLKEHEVSLTSASI